MLKYIRDIITPSVDRVREELGDRKSALVVINNFKGQITPAVNAALDDCDIHVVLLPPNTTDRLQPLDISVNKPAKDFIRGKFQEWYSNKVMHQLSDLDREDIHTAEIQPVDLSMAVMKQVIAEWLVEMAKYFEDHPEIVVNGFIRSGIAGVLDESETDGERSETDESCSEIETDADSEIEYEGFEYGEQDQEPIYLD